MNDDTLGQLIAVVAVTMAVFGGIKGLSDWLERRKTDKVKIWRRGVEDWKRPPS